MPSVFISYSHNDSDTAKKIAETLRENGIDVWRDQDRLYGGQLWPKDIGEAIFSSDALLLIWSRHAEQSKHVDLEWCVAISAKKTVVSCLMDDTPLPSTLRAMQSINVKNLDKACSLIIQSLLNIGASVYQKNDSSFLQALNILAATNPEYLTTLAKTTKAPCPLCGSLIKIHETDWQCPACNTVNHHWMLMTNCEWCRFSPHFLTCPHCKEDFDLWLLMGNYADKTGRPIHESGRRKIRSAIYRHRLGDLKSIMGEPTQEVAQFFTEEFVVLMANVEFYFPHVIRCFMPHTFFISPDDRLWMHSWVYENASPDEQEQPVGQFTLVYPGSSKNSKRDDKKVDCVVNESFW